MNAPKLTVLLLLYALSSSGSSEREAECISGHKGDTRKVFPQCGQPYAPLDGD